MKKLHFTLSILFLSIASGYAQYPTLTAEEKASEEKIKAEAEKLSNEAWEKAKIIVEQEARVGKPFIPWASRPTDLPQADIPALLIFVSPLFRYYKNQLLCFLLVRYV